MDMLMTAQTIDGVHYPTWDVKVENGNVPIVTGIMEDEQRAVLAGFLETGTIPLLPECGVPWVDYLTEKMTFGELDVAVRDSLQKAGADGYQPEYDLEGDRLTMKVGRVENDSY